MRLDALKLAGLDQRGDAVQDGDHQPDDRAGPETAAVRRRPDRRGPRRARGLRKNANALCGLQG